MNKDIIFKEFEKLEALKEGDFIKLEEYGGGPDESSLKGTRNALTHFAWEILKVTLDNKDEYYMDAYVDKDSVAGIDSIEVVEINERNRLKTKRSFKDKIIGTIIMMFSICFLLSAVFGFLTLIKMFLR